MKIKRTGSAAWQGGFKDGKGAISTESGALKAYPYGFASRFEGQQGSNPEELIGAAHAGCFTMALSLILGEAKLTAEQMDTTRQGHAGAGRGRLRHHRRASDAEGQDPRRRPGDVREAGRHGQGRLPGLQAAQGRDHAGRDARSPDRGGWDGLRSGRIAPPPIVMPAKAAVSMS